MTKQDLNLRRKSRNSLERSILSTLALLEAESVPAVSLTSLYESLHKGAEHCPTLHNLREAAQKLARKKLIFSHSGVYSLSSHAESAKERTRRMLTSSDKLRRVKFALTLLEAVPFIESAAITGSVALGNASEKSDTDVFCIAKKGRVWTARAGALCVAELLGKRRDSARSKLCFNYFAAYDADLPVKNIASAHMLALAMPVFGRQRWLHFLGRNEWIRTYICFPYGTAHKSRHFHIPKEWDPLFKVKMLGEKLLAGRLGELLENILKEWQATRLEKKAVAGGDRSHLVLADDVIMLHHPRPKNKDVMERYEKKMKEILQ